MPSPALLEQVRGAVTAVLTASYHDQIQLTQCSHLTAVVQKLEAWQQVYFQRFEILRAKLSKAFLILPLILERVN